MYLYLFYIYKRNSRNKTVPDKNFSTLKENINYIVFANSLKSISISEHSIRNKASKCESVILFLYLFFMNLSFENNNSHILVYVVEKLESAFKILFCKFGQGVSSIFQKSKLNANGGKNMSSLNCNNS